MSSSSLFHWFPGFFGLSISIAAFTREIVRKHSSVRQETGQNVGLNLLFFLVPDLADSQASRLYNNSPRTIGYLNEQIYERMTTIQNRVFGLEFPPLTPVQKAPDSISDDRVASTRRECEDRKSSGGRIWKFRFGPDSMPSPFWSGKARHACFSAL